MKTIVNSIKYTRRFNTGNYEHEELTLDLSPDPEEAGIVDPKEMLLMARKVVAESSLKYLAAQRKAKMEEN